MVPGDLKLFVGSCGANAEIPCCCEHQYLGFVSWLIRFDLDNILATCSFFGIKHQSRQVRCIGLRYDQIACCGGRRPDSDVIAGSSFNVQWKEIKMNDYLKSQLKLILSYRIILRHYFGKDINSARTILDYMQSKQ